MKQIRYIFTGEYHSSAKPMIIGTTLGSCISVCLFDTRNLIGGMNHILLPGTDEFGQTGKDTKYGIYAMELLINDMLKLGADRYSFEAKIFGGASMLSTISHKFPTGERNINFAMEYLDNEKIPIKSYCLGGTTSRRIYFHTDTGKVFVRRYKADQEEDSVSRYMVKNKNINSQFERKDRVIIFDRKE